MLHFIDPTIDFVFKLILGTIGNENLLIDFINRIINPASPIVSVTYINPVNEKQHEKDKFSVVDIKAIDGNGIKYQIEVQLTEPSFLADRMLYTWSSIYHTQAIKGKQFDKLKPVISIWLLTGSMIKSDNKFHHSFGIWDKINNVQLSDHCAIHVVELAKWQKPARLQREDYWLYFFKEAKNWKELPDNLKSLAVMRQAMNTLQSIADSEEAYLAYLAREDQLMIERTIESQLKESKANLTQAKHRAKKAEADKATAEAENAQLLALLKQAGIDPKTL
ncbi:MAG: putative transposase/invertase (TIGR01784 family) [Phenylobacterium sp.]|jgi:predicted transposase/invertase (TIGR01784 family)